MKRFLFLCLLFSPLVSTAQVEVRLIVEGAVIESDCDDLFSGPDLLWQVEVEDEGTVVYPQNSIGTCYTALPNQQYTATYTCPADVPAQLQVCFRPFENDPILPIGCPVAPSCLAEACDNFVIPPPGQSVSYTLSMPGNAVSRGDLNFTIEVESTAGVNGEPCTAIDLGLLANNDTLGNASLGLYNNRCGTLAPGEPNPTDEGGFSNENGVWFQFTTDSDIGSLLLIRALSDPEAAGDSLDIQLAVYTTDNNACDGTFSLASWTSPNNDYDVFMNFRCPQPNTTYYVLVDGAFTVPDSEFGIFGLEVINVGIEDAPNERCDALMLGAVPEGGSVSPPEPLGNFCADAVGDPFSPNFVVQSSVWFQFIAPPSGHVLIDAVSARAIDSIGIQLGLYRALSGCNSFFQHIASQYTFEDLDESMEVTCLFPGEPYYLLIDGDADANRGIFTLTISDAGDITPVTNLDTTICFGDSFSVGSSVYTEPGFYSDTLQVFRGCDSIVNTNLAVLNPIIIEVNQTQPAIGEGSANGIGILSATGGTGNFIFEWCDGSIGPTNNTLVGGAVCCVTVSDDFGCVADTCFTVEFVTDIIPSFTPDTLACFGDENGQIAFSAINGQPPYTYTWRNTDDSINGNGTIADAGEEVILPDLPADVYTITIMDMFFDTTFSVTILEPELLALQMAGTEDASCFGVCDGSAGVEAAGGVGGYQFSWSHGDSGSTVGSLCADSYSVTVTDANGCEEEVSLSISEPEEFIATAVEVQAVSCFEGSDAVISVETNGTPVAYQWSTGDVEQTVSGLPAGPYSVVVANADGCQDEAEVTVSQPPAPVAVEIQVEKPVSCQGDTDAILRAEPSGPGQSFTYQWSNGAGGATASGLGAGAYSVLLTNEKGCEASADFVLSEPSRIQAALSATDVTCVSGENGGAISVDTTFGGTPPYRYALDGVMFGSSSQFAALFAGTYAVVVQDAAGCEEEFAQTVQGAPELMVELGDTRSLRLGDSLLLAAQSASDDLVYSWTLADSTGSKQSGQSIWVAPAISTGYYVEVFDTVTLCRASDFVLVNVRTERRVFIPNAFSPNEDGRNDMFTVYADQAVAQVKSLRVFSRSGSLVFEAMGFAPNNESLGWNGKFRGEELDPGAFTYVAEIEFIDGRTEVYSGDVILVK